MTATTFPATIHIRTRRFVCLLLAVAAMAATLTWAVVSLTTDSTAASSHPTTRAERYVEAITSASPLELAAAYGNAVDALSMTPSARRYVDGIMALTPLEQAAAYGTNPVDALGMAPGARRYVDGIMALSPEQLAATF